MKAAARKGFTLIEILIVVIILGILAAIVIPQFTNASEDAKQSTAATMVQTVRSAIELYKLEYGVTVPPTTDSPTFWAAMKARGTHPTIANKNIGPYLQETPANPLVSSTDASTVSLQALAGGNAPATTASAGWVMDKDTGRIWILSKTGSVFK